MSIQTIGAAVLCLVGLVTPAYAAELTLPQSGWASWQVDAVHGAPAWCCWSSSNARAASRMSCRLDDDHGNVGAPGHAKTDAVRIYALVAGGKVERLRVLSATCPVEAATPIRVIETTTDDSARWVATLAKRSNGAVPSRDFGENVLLALAMHRGDVARDALAAIARADERAALDSIRRGNTKRWIWFPHGGVQNSVEAIAEALKKESEEHFRE